MNSTILQSVFLIIILLDAVLGLTLWRIKLLETKMLPVVFAVTVSIADELLAFYFRVRFHNNLIVYYTSSSIEYACFVWFLYLNMDFIVIKKAIIATVIMFFVARIGYVYFYIQLDALSASKVSGGFITSQDVLIAFFSICYFKNIFNNVADYKPLNFCVLIIVTGLLFYYSFDSITRLVRNHLVNIYEQQLIASGADIKKARLSSAMQAYYKFTQVNTLVLLTNILLYLCIFTAFIKNAIIVKKSLSRA